MHVSSATHSKDIGIAAGIEMMANKDLVPNTDLPSNRRLKIIAIHR
jgi:hypothetical protein